MAEKSGSKKQVIFLAVLVLIVALVAAGYILTANSPVKSNKIIESGDRAPEFRLPGRDGRMVSLSDFRGKVVLVHFWATWCPSCVEELPILDKLYREPSLKNLVLLAVSVDEDGADSVAPFMLRNKLSMPVLFDPGGAIAKFYGTYKLPETYIVDQQGVVRYKAIGPKDWTDPRNIKILQDMLGAT
ncbi:MAG TPA: TlpA disulfide reductase family protein [Nitrospirota bacterium]